MTSEHWPDGEPVIHVGDPTPGDFMDAVDVAQDFHHHAAMRRETDRVAWHRDADWLLLVVPPLLLLLIVAYVVVTA